MHDLPWWWLDCRTSRTYEMRPASLVESHHLETMFLALQTPTTRRDNNGVNVIEISRVAFVLQRHIQKVNTHAKLVASIFYSYST